MIIKTLEKSFYSDWNSFVRKSPQGSLFSETWYLDILKVKYQVLCVIDEDNSIIAGIVLAKNQINTYSNPMLDKYLGVLLKDEVLPRSQKTLSKQYKAQELLVSDLKKYKSFDYYFHSNYTNWIPFYWKGFTQQTRYTYRINLKENIDDIQKKFHGNLRNDIKNAIKNDINIIRDIDFDSFFDIINKTFLRQGSKAPFDKLKLKSFIEKMNNKGCYNSFAARDSKGNTIAVCGIVHDSKSSYLILNGIDIKKHIRGANALMLFESIKYYQSKCNLYDFEGSMLPGVEQFYRRFGGELASYYRIWSDNFFNYTKTKAKKVYKKMRYGR